MTRIEKRQLHRRTADRALFADERFRLLVGSVQDYAIFMLDPQGRILTWNAGAQRLKQYTAEEIVGESFERFYPADAVASNYPQQELEAAARDGRFEDEGWRIRKDGSKFWANVILSAVQADDGTLQGFAKVTRDLTERREHEELLRRSEEQLRLLLESVTDYAIFMLDVEGKVLTWNTGAQSIKGYGADEVLGRHFSMFFTEEDRATGTPDQELAQASLNGRAQSEGWRVRKDGQRFWASVVITPIWDSVGKLRGYAKVTRDMTEQRRIEEVERSRRHIEEFIALLAHELRNPLAPIRNAVRILELQPGMPTPAIGATAIIGRQATHLTRLVDDLLDVGRIVTGKIVLLSELVDYRHVVTLSVEATRPAIESKRHRLHVHLPDAPVMVMGDATRLSQALQNLMLNAARYTPDGGDIAVELTAHAGQLRCTVKDNGIGIAREARTRIFDLFVQERDPRIAGDGGLGIGLSLAQTLIGQHGGTLSMESDGADQGSTFLIALPTVAGLTTHSAASPAEPVPDGSSHRILVVDDNRDSADSMVELLQILGHEAHVAYGAQEAIATATKLRPAVILLDLSMPDGDGFSVLKQVRLALGPAVHVIAMTGYGQKSDLERTQAAGFNAHLTKPLDLDKLEDMLKQLTGR